MERRRRRSGASARTVVLDSGSIIAWARRAARVQVFIRVGLAREETLVVPVIVVAETCRGTAGDSPVNWLLSRVVVPPADLEIAREAGRLLGRTGGSNAPDALVVAEALRRAPCTILTSDPDDIRRLVGSHPDVELLDINAL